MCVLYILLCITIYIIIKNLKQIDEIYVADRYVCYMCMYVSIYIFLYVKRYNLYLLTNSSRIVFAKSFLRVISKFKDVLRGQTDSRNSQVSTNDRFSSDNYRPTLES